MTLTLARQTRPWSAPARLAATLALVLAFFVQCYITQTHMHFASAASGWSITGQIDGSDSDKRVPVEGSKCPVCQSTAHGQFITPSAAATLSSLLSVSTIVVTVEARRLIYAVSHSWQGRAPPHN